MHLDPEKYHYIFEKYLRADLGKTDLNAFEEKLNQDEAFKLEFENYKLNRTEILKKGLEEYEKPILKTDASKKINWLYLLVSLLSLILVADYFIHSTSDDALQPKRNIFSRSIGMFKSDKKNAVTTKQQFQSETENSAVKQMVSLPNDSSALNGTFGLDSSEINEAITTEFLKLEDEIFVSEKLYDCFLYADWENMLETVSYEVDSILSDSLMMERAILALTKKKQLLNLSVLVEFWESANQLKAYQFDGKKLMLYGVDASEPFYFLCDESKSRYFMIMQQQLIQLKNNNQLTKIYTP